MSSLHPVHVLYTPERRTVGCGAQLCENVMTERMCMGTTVPRGKTGGGGRVTVLTALATASVGCHPPVQIRSVCSPAQDMDLSASS